MSTHATPMKSLLKKRKRSRHGGFAVVHVSTGIFAFLGAAALAVDLSRQYATKSGAQNAADGNWTAAYNSSPQEASLRQMSYEGPPAETSTTTTEALRLIR